MEFLLDSFLVAPYSNVIFSVLFSIMVTYVGEEGVYIYSSRAFVGSAVAQW